MIKGSLCKLRAIEPEDENAYFSWINDDESNQWRGLYHPTSREEAHNWTEERRKNSATTLNFAILTADGAHIGFIGIKGICPRSRRAELWIYIGDKNYWNRGIGESAVQALCRYSFEQMNLYRLWLECNPDYENVVRVYAKLGFKREGTLRHAYYRHGEFRDTCIMALLRPEFEESGVQT